MKKFDEWNRIKKSTEELERKVYFKERDIFYMKIGENIGFEQGGKGNKFQRPVVVIKKFNQHFFLGTPLTSTEKGGRYYFEFQFLKEKKSYAILSQVRAFDKRRLMDKVGMISKEDFLRLKEKLAKLL